MKRTAPPVLIALLLACLALALVGCSAEQDVVDETAPAGDASTAAERTAPTGTDSTASEPGKEAFVKLHCDVCHPVTTAQIEGGTEAGPDLAGIAAQRTGEDLAAFISGPDHPGLWQGTPEEAREIADWLAKQ